MFEMGEERQVCDDINKSSLKQRSNAHEKPQCYHRYKSQEREMSYFRLRDKSPMSNNRASYKSWQESIKRQWQEMAQKIEKHNDAEVYLRGSKEEKSRPEPQQFVYC